MPSTFVRSAQLSYYIESIIQALDCLEISAKRIGTSVLCGDASPEMPDEGSNVILAYFVRTKTRNDGVPKHMC